MIRLLLIAGCLLLSGVCFTWAQDAKDEAVAHQVNSAFSADYQKAYDQAFQDFNDNQYEEALKQLDVADKIQPDAIEALNLRGGVYVRMKKYEDAQKIFTKLYQKDPSNTMALFNLGETYFLQKNYSEALTYFRIFSDKSKIQNALGQYKVFLCNLLLEKDEEVKKTLEETVGTISDPLYYYIHSAYEFKHNHADDGRGYMAAAFQIYSGEVNSAYVNSLIELGYVSPGDLQGNSGGALPVVQQTNNSESVAAGNTAPTPVKPVSPDLSTTNSALPSLDNKNSKK
jgi:hypothetical protein